MLAVLDRARIARITPVVLPTKFQHALLSAASGRVVGQMGALGISFVGVSNYCSGLDVGLVNDTAQGEATVQGIAGAGIPVHFSQMADAVAL